MVYAVAMGVDAVFAAVTRALFDRIGPKVLLALPVVCAAIPLFACADALWAVVVGVVLWGASLGVAVEVAAFAMLWRALGKAA